MTNRKLTIISISLLSLFLVAIFATFKQQAQDKSQLQQNNSPQTEEKRSELEEFPIVDFSQSTFTEETDARKAKNKYFNKSYSRKLKEDKEILVVTQAESWIESLPAIPINKSDIILIGTVADSQAYISEDRTNVYSEFNVLVNEVLHNQAKTSINQFGTISVMRDGGRIRFDSGHTQTYLLSGQGTPINGKTYLMFIRELPSTKDVILLTAYEIIGDKIYPVDNVKSHLLYKRTTIEEFRREIEKALAHQHKEETN